MIVEISFVDIKCMRHAGTYILDLKELPDGLYDVLAVAISSDNADSVRPFVGKLLTTSEMLASHPYCYDGAGNLVLPEAPEGQVA